MQRHFWRFPVFINLLYLRHSWIATSLSCLHQVPKFKALCTFNDIMSNPQIIMAIKLKITIHFNNVIISPNLLILPSLASSARIGSRSVYRIPVHSFNLLRSIFPSWLASSKRMRSRGDCEWPDLSIISRTATNASDLLSGRILLLELTD